MPFPCPFPGPPPRSHLGDRLLELPPLWLWRWCRPSLLPSRLLSRSRLDDLPPPARLCRIDLPLPPLLLLSLLLRSRLRRLPALLDPVPRLLRSSHSPSSDALSSLLPPRMAHDMTLSVPEAAPPAAAGDGDEPDPEEGLLMARRFMPSITPGGGVMEPPPSKEGAMDEASATAVVVVAAAPLPSSVSIAENSHAPAMLRV